MAGETLRTVAQMLAAFPDNTQGLISPLDARDMIVSEAVNVGFLNLDNGPSTIPITVQNEWVSMNANISPTAFASNFWKVDGNNAFTQSYTDQGITVQSGTFRLTTFAVGGLVSKVGGGTNLYEIALFTNGVQASPPFVFASTATPEYFRIQITELPDYSLSEVYDMRVRCIDGTSDLVFDEWRMQAQGFPL